MSTQRFFACLALAVGVIGAFNVFLAVKMDSVPKLIMRQMRAEPRIDVLLLGNSLMQSGFDSSSFAAAWPSPNPAPRTFNAGLGLSSPVEHYLLARQAYLHHRQIACLIYGFYDFQLTEHASFSWSELEGNRSMVYTTDPSTAASLYAPGSIMEKWRFRLIGAVPMLSGHSQLWKYVELFRRSLQEFGMPAAKTNQFGRIGDFKSMAFPDSSGFKQECESSVKNSFPLVPAIQAILQLARDQNTQVIVVEMPMTSAHRDRYYSSDAWLRYRAYLQQRLQVEGANYINASQWVPDDADFSDGLHLNTSGASLFSTRLAQAIVTKFKVH